MSRSGRATQAARADRHALYQRSVQDPPWEMDFVADTFRAIRGREARSLREDFCGTAAFSCEWVRRDRRNTAVGVDMEPSVLAWCRAHNLTRLAPGAVQRLKLLQADVMQVHTAPMDVVAAFNFSYWVFKDRATLRRYFRRVRESLRRDGIFMLDAYGGSDAVREMRERDDRGTFTYIWDQADYDPVSAATVCHIHFAFPDGSRLNRAFSYHWRLWNLVELREVLAEAGFTSSRVYWEGTDPDTGEGDGAFKPVERGEADQAWVAYIVAEK